MRKASDELSDEIYEVIDKALVTMSTSKQISGRRTPLTHFQDAFCSFSELRRILGVGDAEMNDVTTLDLDRPLDVAISFSTGDDMPMKMDDLPYMKTKGLGLVRIRRISFREARALGAKRFFERTYELAAAHFEYDRDGVYTSKTVVLGENDGRNWHIANVGHGYDDMLRLASSFAKDACERQFTARFEWQVSLGYGDGGTLAFETDPIGAREIFRLRDIPNGASRRAALLHWVQEHWRKKPSDPAEATKVREHLRGASNFEWNGLRCKIRPSDFDTEKALLNSVGSRR